MPRTRKNHPPTDEAKVGTYTLPDPLVLDNGRKVTDAKMRYTTRRPEIVQLFEEDQYGKSPGRPAGLHFDVFDKGTPALDGRAIRRQVTMSFTWDGHGPKVDLLLYLPAEGKGSGAGAAGRGVYGEFEHGGRSLQGPGGERGQHESEGRRQKATAGDCQRAAVAQRAALPVGRKRVPFAVWHPRAFQGALRHPFVMQAGGREYRVDYEPGESTTGLFGGNSNWRGPVWFPVNYLLIESLQKYHHYYGNDSRVECATGSGLFLPDGAGRRPVHGGNRLYAEDPHWKDLVLFYEYFHGEEGHGVGASHQTGWTGLTGKLLQQNGE